MKKSLCENRLKKHCKRFGVICSQANEGKYFAEYKGREYSAWSINGLHKEIFGYN